MKSVLEGIGQKLIDEKADGHGDVDGNGHVISLEVEPDVAGAVCMHHCRRDLTDIMAKVDDFPEAIRLEILVKELHRLDASGQSFQIDLVARALAACLQTDESGDQLQVVFYPVLELFQQHILVAEAGV